MVNIMANYINASRRGKGMRPHLVVMIFLVLPVALATVDVSLDQSLFNIGDSVEIEASVDAERSMNAFVRLTAVCGGFSLPYYMSPLELQAGFRSQVEAPPLKVASSMQGECVIKAEVVDENGAVVEQGSTQEFEVSDELQVVLLNENLSTLPGTQKKIEGLVRGASGNTVNADIALQFGGEEYTTATFNGKFALMLAIPQDARTGMHELSIAAHGGQNSGSTAAQVEVIAVPIHLTVELQPEAQNPGGQLQYTVTITDQAGDLLHDAASITITQPDGTYIFKGGSMSGEASSYQLGQYAAPGEYILSASYNILAAEARFAINTVKDVRVTQQDETVAVENIGNVPYEEDISIIAESNGKSYHIKKGVELAPGEVGVIELSEELPSGKYSILLPQLTAFLAENGTVGERQLLAENVEVHDNRSPLKKMGSGLRSMTGAIIGAEGIITNNGWAAPVILISIILLIALYFTRDIWLVLLMRRR
jgi:hypothetical protein